MCEVGLRSTRVAGWAIDAGGRMAIDGGGRIEIDEGGRMSWETVIGLEIHVQLRTAEKLFCSDETVFGATPQ